MGVFADAGARQHGPLGSFDGSHRWIAGPASAGIVLVGDASARTETGSGRPARMRAITTRRSQSFARPNAFLPSSSWQSAARQTRRGPVSRARSTTRATPT